MTKSNLHPIFQASIVLPTLLFALISPPTLLAQGPPYNVPATSLGWAQPDGAAPLSNLVAPIALYPDPLLSQILVASTYPLELAQAEQWLQRNRNLPGYQLVDAAKQQNWDPSVQLLTAFPAVLAMFSGNIRWTSDLGSAFLSRQREVMDAIQSLRAQAYANGRLADTPQLSIDTEEENGQSAIEIQPADPQMLYVPAYDPSSVWGPPGEGAYPSLPYQGNGFGSFFQSIANLAELFPGFPGLLGGKAWGWAVSWLAHLLFTNNSFFSDLGFQNVGGGYGGSSVWVHNSGYGLGAPNPNGFVAGRFGGGRSAGRTAPPYTGSSSGWRMFGSGAISSSQAARPILPSRWVGSGNSQWSNRAPTSGNWHGFSNGAQAPGYHQFTGFAPSSSYGNRELQPYNRVAAKTYNASSANYRTPHPERQFRQSSSSGFSANNNYGTRSESRLMARSSESFSGSFNQSSGQTYRSSPSRVNFQSSSFSKKSSAPQRSPKPQHFSAPHFSTHSAKHSQAHFSKSHAGGKSKHKGK